MKKAVKFTAIAMVLALMLTVFAGCHKKNEVAFTIGDTEFTSAFYSCVLYNTAKSTRSAIDAYVSSIETDSEEAKKTVYADFKFDDKGNVDPNGSRKYNDFVKEETVKLLKQYAAVYAKLKESENLLTDDEKYSTDMTAQSYWYIGCDYNTYYYYSSYGYDMSSFTPLSTDLTANGVALETYTLYCEYEAMLEKYFNLLYSEGGEKEVSKDELNAYLSEHFVVADLLSFSMNDESGEQKSEDELTALKAKIDAYADRINAGESFKTIVDEYNAENTTETEETETEEEETEDEGEGETEGEGEDTFTPESYMNLLGDSETDYSSELFDGVKAIEVGKAAVTTDSTGAYYVLESKEDILAESYWLDQVKTSILLTLKQDEYNEYLNEFSASLGVKESTYATGAFKVKNIEFTSSAN